ncbi:hypothetical protein ILYODFUR_036079 [Ilyodon furcidens]|uniref:Uncharacterized protein n=1 Tax=Ilyodon furcidens TaxID=33524 RepID=A0ABV0T456_9TELE
MPAQEEDGVPALHTHQLNIFLVRHPAEQHHHSKFSHTCTSTCSTHSLATRRLQPQHHSPFNLFLLLLFLEISLRAASTYNQRDGPVVPVDLQPTGDQLLPVAPAASLRRGRRRRRCGFVVLPQVIKRAEDPGDGQNGDGVGPYPAHGEPIRRAPEASPAGSGPSAGRRCSRPRR